MLLFGLATREPAQKAGLQMHKKEETRLARFGFMVVFGAFGLIAGAVYIIGPLVYGAALMKLADTDRGKEKESKVTLPLKGVLSIAMLALAVSAGFLMDVSMVAVQVSVFIITCLAAPILYKVRLPRAPHA